MAIAAKEITWQRDFEAARRDAQQKNAHVLLDFSAAPA